MNEEQERRFWEWCGLGCAHKWEYIENKTPLWGLDCMKCGQEYRSSQWSRKSTPEIGDIERIPLINLDNIFKYGVTTLKKKFSNWKSVLHDWIDEGDLSPEALFKLLYEAAGLEA